MRGRDVRGLTTEVGYPREDKTDCLREAE